MFNLISSLQYQSTVLSIFVAALAFCHCNKSLKFSLVAATKLFCGDKNFDKICHYTGQLKASVQERPQWNFWSFFYFAPIFPVCCTWTKINKNYIVLYFFLPISAFSSRNNLCKNLVGVLCFLLFKAKYKRNGLSPLFHKINGAGHLSLIWIQCDLLNVIVN